MEKHALLISASVTSEPLSSSRILYGSSLSSQSSIVETECQGTTPQCNRLSVQVLVLRHLGSYCCDIT